MLQDSVCCIYSNLIICSVTVGKTQIVVQTFNLGETEHKEYYIPPKTVDGCELYVILMNQ